MRGSRLAASGAAPASPAGRRGPATLRPAKARSDGPLIGAHVSVSGGFPRAVDRALAIGCRTLQVFVKGTVNWRVRDLDDAEAARFRLAVTGSGLGPVIAHASYLTNLAEDRAVERRRAIDGLVAEVERCDLLGISALVLHPGAHCGRGARAGLARVREALAEVVARSRDADVQVLVENSAGQGSSLGSTLDELAELIAVTGAGARLGLCIDTCHAFAAGYDLRSAHGWDGFWESLDRLVGIHRVGAIHVNDSRRELGARVDRHQHIGRGHLGPEPFRRLMRDPRLEPIPKLIETPKAGDMDRRNLAWLRRAARPPSARRPGPSSR